jgi:tetratricopeptide (TPR) repeat protein
MNGRYHPVPKIIFSLVFLLSFFASSVNTGCSKLPTGNREAVGKKWICDRDADDAMNRYDYEAGISLHERLLEKQPENALAIYHLGYAYGRTRDHQNEAFCYEKAITLGLRDEQIYFNLGMAYGELNHMEKSIAAFKKALEINPNSADYHFELAMAYLAVMDKKPAEEEFLKVIRIDQGNVEARLLLSSLYVEWGELQKAAQQIREILKIDPANEEAQKILERMQEK